ncbi:MAG: CPBP family intramembrane glutamic endopeptidase [Nocardioides sp.]
MPYPSARVARPVLPSPPEYHQLHRGGRRGWWWAVLGAVLVPVLGVGVVPAIFLAPIAVYRAASSSGGSLDAETLMKASPALLAALNVGLGLSILLAMGATWALHGLEAGLGVLRGAPAALALAGGLPGAVRAGPRRDVGGDLPAAAGRRGRRSTLNAFTAETRNYLLVILLLTPFQAAGEEYAFRGYLTQALGGLFTPLGTGVSRAAAVVLPALLFALAHGLGQSVPVFFDRLAFGLVAGWLVIRTGGLEAGIAMHVLNNFLAYGLALAFGNMDDALNATGGSWWMIPTTLTQSLVYLGLVTWLARRWGLQRRADPAVLAA